jgi:hypothetical protein
MAAKKKPIEVKEAPKVEPCLEIVKMALRAWGGVTTDAEAERVIDAIAQYESEGYAIGSCGDFSRVVSERAGITMASDFTSNCTNKNTVYTVTSTGSVGDVVVTITTVIDQSDSDAGRVKYWRVD